MDVIQLENVSKRYVLGIHSTTAREAMSRYGRRLVRRRADPGEQERREIWALRELSFAVAHGGSLGIVGRNGAGKSTILKLLARITTPTVGVSRTRGRVAALLEVGTGFHLELTGRENIYLNGVILGMSRRDVRNRFDEIVEFAGLERFLSTPVKRYSSGMYLRLAFAVAAHLDPDVLIVDEVLAVGDAEFQRKCLGRISEVEQEGRTVVFVSHDLHALGRVCKRALWIDAGRLKMDAPTSDVVRAYLASLGEAGSGTAELQRRAGPVTLRRIRVGTGDGAPPLRDEPLEIVVEFAVHESVLGLDLAIYVTSADGVRLLDEALRDTYSGDIAIGEYRVSLTVPPILNVGEYTVGVWFGASYADFFDESALTTFSLEGTDRSRPDRAVVLGLPMHLSPIAP